MTQDTSNLHPYGVSRAADDGEPYVDRVIEVHFNRCPTDDEIRALHDYLRAFPAASLDETSNNEPVAWRCKNGFGEWRFTAVKPDTARYPHWEPVYAAPALKASETSEQRRAAIEANALADAHRMYEAEHGYPQTPWGKLK